MAPSDQIATAQTLKSRTSKADRREAARSAGGSGTDADSDADLDVDASEDRDAGDAHERRVVAVGRLDVRALIEAAEDLGCSRLQAFWLVTVPLSKNGIIAG